MDVLATFPDTATVLQAEQVLIRRGIAFETVPRSRHRRGGCGLAIRFASSDLPRARAALDAAHIPADFQTLAE